MTEEATVLGVLVAGMILGAGLVVPVVFVAGRRSAAKAVARDAGEVSRILNGIWTETRPQPKELTRRPVHEPRPIEAPPASWRPRHRKRGQAQAHMLALAGTDR